MKDRVQDARVLAGRPRAAHPQGELKQREIRFSRLPPGQADEGHCWLCRLERLEASRGPHPRGVSVRYLLGDYTLEGIEGRLQQHGFHLDNTLYSKLVRALVSFSEQTQLRNLQMPERLLKQSNEVYVRAWENHPHGDRDEMPPELREYK
ncbi:MAG: hypothetical protein OHK0026_01230 [Rhodocyclaceae bacterium]